MENNAPTVKLVDRDSDRVKVRREPRPLSDKVQRRMKAYRERLWRDEDEPTVTVTKLEEHRTNRAMRRAKPGPRYRLRLTEELVLERWVAASTLNKLVHDAELRAQCDSLADLLEGSGQDLDQLPVSIDRFERVFQALKAGDR